MLHFDADQTRRLLPMSALIDALALAAVELADGGIRCPERLVVPLSGAGVLLSMPAVAVDLTVHKLISVMPANAPRAMPAIQGHLTIMDTATGTPRMLLDGPTVTGRRTAAMSLLGLRTLRPGRPRHVLLIGAGTQAMHHVAALAEIHPGVRVTVGARSARSAARLVAAHAGAGLDLRIADHDIADRAEDATSAACAIPDDVDVVITCTTSPEAVYRAAAADNRLLIAVGAFQPHAAEIAAATVRASQVVVDDPAGARHEAGDLIRAGVDWQDVIALEALLRQAPEGSGAELASRAVLFKTVGCAAWDLAAARLAMQTAA